MGLSRAELVGRLWRGADPFEGFPRHLYQVDKQGWACQHHYLVDWQIIATPLTIVEVGVWKGGSTIAMASRLRDAGASGTVIAVDTWLGSWDHWIDDEWFGHLGFDHGYPTMNKKFMNNVVGEGLQSFVLPLPLDSLNAAVVLKEFGVRPDVVHLDGAHDFDAVTADLNAWWSLLNPGGLLIGDDYWEDTHWPDVKRAFDTFFRSRRPGFLEHTFGKCRVRKDVSDMAS